MSKTTSYNRRPPRPPRPALPRARAPAPKPLVDGPSAGMRALMSEIVVKPPPAPVRVRERPHSAVYGRSLEGTLLAPPAAKQRPPSAPVFSRLGQPAASAAPAAVQAAAQPAVVLEDVPPSPARSTGFRARGSRAPPDAANRPRDSMTFERLTPGEAADSRAGLAGTTLPGAVTLAAAYETHAQQVQVKAAEKAATQAAAVAAHRKAAAEKAAVKVPASQTKFAWGPERIANALLVKFDQFTARHEDHTRKLLWTMGTDPNFTASTNRKSISVTPGNFPRVCDRFGIMCSENAAEKIFDHHGLPKDGCSVYRLSKSFIDSKVDMANIVRQQSRLMHGDAARPRAVTRPKSPQQRHDPYRLAHLPSAAWKDHREEARGARAAAGSRSGSAAGGGAHREGGGAAAALGGWGASEAPAVAAPRPASPMKMSRAPPVVPALDLSDA